MMRKMKDSGVELIGKIPTNWNIKRLKNISKIYGRIGFRGYTTNDIVAEGEGAITLSPSNINSNLKANYNKCTYISWKKYNESPEIMIDNGDIIFVKTGSSYGKSAIIRDLPLNATINPQLIVFKEISIDNDFLLYFLQTSSIKKEVEGVVSGGTIPTLSQEKISNFHICIPPLPEQLSISTYLDRKCALIDSVIEKTKASIEEYKKLRQAVITQAVTKGVRGDRPMKDSGIEWIGEIPQEWTPTKIKWLLFEQKERSETGEEEPLSMSQKYGIIPTKEMDIVPNMASSFVGAKLVSSGDLVFNKLKAHLGVFAVSKYVGLVSPDYAVYRSTGKADLRFLEYMFKTPQCISEFKKKSTGVGAGLTRLYTDGLYSIYIPLPPKLEQQEIADYIDKKCSEIDAIITKKETFLTELDKYKKSLIYECVTGKREVPSA